MLSMINEKHAPLRKRRVAERYTPWYTSELTKLSKVRDKIKKAAVKNQSDLLLAAYKQINLICYLAACKQIRNKFTNMNQKLKRDFFSDKIKTFEGNMKETWKTINQMINKRSKTTHISSLEDDDKDITDSQRIADAMNQYFCNIGEKLSSKIPTRKNPLLSGDVKINQHSKIFRFKNVDEVQICRAMKRLKKSNGFGLDGISSYFLKVGMPVLPCSLSTIFNNSLRCGVFPNCWKTARIAPIFKDGPENIKSNYLPIWFYQRFRVYLRKFCMANFTNTWMKISSFTCTNLGSDHCTLVSHAYSRARIIGTQTSTEAMSMRSFSST